MLHKLRPLLGFLYALLFASLVGMSLGPSVGGWITTNYGGWFTLEAVAAYIAYLVGLICLINAINTATGFVPPPDSTPLLGPMVPEMQFIRNLKASEYSDERPADLPDQTENGPKA